MRQLRRNVALFLCLCFATNLISPVVRAAESMNDIRIGLVKLYEKKAKITIKTTKIGLGYSISNSYHCEQTFTSKSGFSFQPATGYYYILDRVYPSYRQALTTVNQINGDKVRAYPVSVGRNSWKVYIGGMNTISATETMKNMLSKEIRQLCQGPYADNGHRVCMTGSGIAIMYDGGVSNSYPQFKSMIQNNQKAAVLDLVARQYRGRIEVGRYGNSTLTAVNIVSIESYLYGVIPAEMPSGWPQEALRAQAICARSYALSKTGYGTDTNTKIGYRLSDTTSSQVYIGYDVETTKTNRAVDHTKGMVITYKGEIVPSYYFSTSGGRTEDVKDVWGIQSDYLKSTVDEYESEPEKEPWIVSFTATQIQEELEACGYKPGSIQKIEVQSVSPSGRVKSLKIIGMLQTIVLQTEKIRNVLNLASTKFKIVNAQSNPDLVYAKGTGQIEAIELNNCYLIQGSGQIFALGDTSNSIYIVKSADNLTPFSSQSPAQSDVYYFVGLGSGHGVGMSQSGAKGMAAAGYDYRRIIQHYYKGCLISYLN